MNTNPNATQCNSGDFAEWREATEPRTVVKLDGDTFGAEILEGSPSGRGVSLYWDDYVANDWCEVHPDLPTALARLAVLQYAVTRDAGFTRNPDRFAVTAARFLADEAYPGAHPEEQGREYWGGLPVGVTVYPSGRVVYEVDTTEASDLVHEDGSGRFTDSEIIEDGRRVDAAHVRRIWGDLIAEGATHIEAHCLSCGETFLPSGPEDLEHAEKADGTECGGTGVIRGGWTAPPQ